MSLTHMETRELKMLEGIGAALSHGGKTLKEVGFRREFRINVLAIHRQGVNLKADFNSVKLAFGDTLFMEGPGCLQSPQEAERLCQFVGAAEVKVNTRKVWIGVGIAAALSSVPP